MGCSNYLTGFLNLATFILSIPIIAFGVWLSKTHDTVCVRFLQYPIIVLGVFILLMSLAGMIGAWCDKRFLMLLYLIVMFLLIVLLFCFTIFAFVVTNSGAGSAVSGKGYKEYKLGDYSTWLQKRVDNPSYWAKIKSCIADSKVCNDLSKKYTDETAFDKASLTPLESGCCKPPTSCGFTYVSPIMWTGTPTGTDSDCTTWNNNSTMLCTDCNSCRGGVLQNVKSNWRKVAIANIIVLVFLIFVYSCGCCAYRNSKREGYSKGYP
jgi:hypothetical protein